MANKKIKKTKKEQKEQEKKRRKLFILLLFLMFLFSLLTAVTYAWFSSNRNALIDAIDINVATVTGIQVSADAINWSNEITKEQLENAYRTYPRALNQLPETLAGVSTDGSVSDGKMNMFYGLTSEGKDNNFYLTTKKQTEINCVGDEACNGKHYIAFDIFLLTTGPADLVVTTNSSVVNRGTNNDGGQNAARVGFVVLGTLADTSRGAAAQNLANANGSYIWEPNYDVHTEYGVNAARSIYGISTSRSGGARIPYRGVNREFSDPVNISATGSSPYFSAVNPDVATTMGFTTDQPLTSIPAGITKMRIYMWLEGQDVDLENSVAQGELTFNLEIAMAN